MYRLCDVYDPERAITGIYAITVNSSIVYIGQAKDVYQRINQHRFNIFNQKQGKENKYEILQSAAQKFQIKFYLVIECDGLQLNQKELELIKMLKPCLNSVGNNNRGKFINSNEFYNEVYNNQVWISGMKFMK